MNKPGIFFYDGDCPFCYRMAGYLQKLCRSKEIEFISFRSKSPEELIEVHPELTLHKLEGEVQYIINGTRYPGFFGVRKLSHSLSYLRFFSVLLYLPLVPFLGMFVLYMLKRFTRH